MDIVNILWALLWFSLFSIVFGAALAIASKVFAVKTDERTEAVAELLPGANCGGCGYAGCAACAEAIVRGDAKTTACSAGGQEIADKIAAVMGQKSEQAVRMRAQVMCSGTLGCAKKKYVYEGAHDCISAARLGGGDKECPNGCIGLGTCASACKFGAIVVTDGVAAIDYEKCVGCGTCVERCPKHIIKLIPYDSAHWVGCMSHDKGAVTRKYCDIGCIACGLCKKVCESGAIDIVGNTASIDYSKCTGCGKCVEKCPRKIIWSRGQQLRFGVTITSDELEEKKTK